MSVEIIPFEAEHASAFYALNRAWLDAHDLYEPPDEQQLAHPLDSIVAVGGAIYIAMSDGEVVGTAAVVPSGDRTAEIVKLTVAQRARGQGLGRRLAVTCIEHARARHFERISLVSSTRLREALALYESMGFEHRPMPSHVPYQTADVYMELKLLDEVRGSRPL